MRQRQEVQALPRRQLRWPPTAPAGDGGPERVDIPEELGRWPHGSQRPSGSSEPTPWRSAGPNSSEASAPDLWDDADHARRGHHASSAGSPSDLELLDGLAARLSDAETLYELMRGGGRRVAAAGDSRTSLADLDRTLGALELRSLFTGEYDDGDAVAEIHARAGGTDAQDWAEMMLRMYQRWAERRGFTIEVEEATEGQEAGLLSATFIVRGRYAFGLLAAERGVHRLVRISPFDAQHRRQTSFASVTWCRSSRTCPARSTSTRRTSASTPTARRAPAASTST